MLHLLRTRSIVLIAALVAPLHARAELACTLDQMQVSPASVIDPCSAALDQGGLGDADKAQIFNVRGRGYARTGHTLLAAQDFDVALKLAPGRSDIWVSRANAEGKLGRWEEDWNDLQRALTLNPKEARAWFAIGQLYKNGGDDDQALEAFGRALAADPAEPYSLLQRSDIYAARHQFADAMADATALVSIPSATINKVGYVDNRGVLTNFHVVALDHRASLYESVGNQAAADRDLESAIAEQPSAVTFQHLAASLLLHKQPERALKDADEAVRLDPADGDGQFLRGQVLLALERNADALDAFDKAITAHGRIVVSREQIGMDYLMRARMLRGLDRTDDAIASIAHAVAVSPEVKEFTVRAMTVRGYWTGNGTSTTGDAFGAALRACMIDKDCN